MATLFDYVGTINNKVGVMPMDNIDEFNSVYVQYVVNMAFCRYTETIMLVDELVLMNNLTNLQHFDYLFNTVPQGKRYSKWNKADKNLELDTIVRIYNYSYDKAKQVVDLFQPDDLEKLKERLFQGGKE
jgi:hypothetical protein